MGPQNTDWLLNTKKGGVFRFIIILQSSPAIHGAEGQHCQCDILPKFADNLQATRGKEIPSSTAPMGTLAQKWITPKEMASILMSPHMAASSRLYTEHIGPKRVFRKVVRVGGGERGEGRYK